MEGPILPKGRLILRCSGCRPGRKGGWARAVSPSPFSHVVPIIDTVPVSKILKLREAEAPAFELYRQSVSKSLEQAKGNSDALQCQIFYDIVKPELVRLENSIRRSRKLLLKSAAQDLIFAAGSVAIGLFGHFLPPELRVGLGGFGGVHYTHRLMQSMTKLLGDPTEAIHNRYYFLWKLTRLKKSGSEGGSIA